MNNTTKPNKIERKIKVDIRLIEQTLNAIQIEKQVIVHCYFKATNNNISIRIWKSTYLRDLNSLHKSKLLTSHNINIYPNWTEMKNGKDSKFTLIFSGLPRSCTSFHLFELIPRNGGFYSETIHRNKTDVYTVEIYS